MKVFALSDLHLALAAPFQPGCPPNAYKPMDVFGINWHNHYQHLYDNWQATVSPEDAVLISGDISWAMTLAEANHDFGYLGQLPGQIILIKGNHDYWWQGIGRVRAALSSNCHALQHSCFVVGNKAVCGSRGWLTPDMADFSEAADRKIYERELLRVRMALDEGKQHNLPLVLLLHYPPAAKSTSHNTLLELIAEYQVEICVYGHIHGTEAKQIIEGQLGNTLFINASCDRLKFSPLLLWSTDDPAARADI